MSAEARTSLSDPLQIAAVELPDGGAIGITLCPGKQQAQALNGAWARDLDTDLRAIRAWGAELLVSLLEDHELAELGVAGLPAAAAAAGLEFHRLPVPDGEPPGKEFEFHWLDLGPELQRRLRAGGRVVIHCKGGLGRAGTVAARLLIELGEPPWSAVNRVREARPGAIETAAQEHYLMFLRS
ncbi:MAG TPA: cyclin-dependent kinase inhibitor 3 family protein [Gammaproteobacteria bacterium]